MPFVPQDPNFEERVRSSFSRQKVMETIGAKMTKVLPGEVEIELPYNINLTQQDGFIHAGITTTIVDSACGYAAYSLMSADSKVLSVEFKINLMAPAIGTHLIARAKVNKAGRTLTFCTGDVFAVRNGKEKLVATMLATLMRLPKQEPSKDD